MNTEHLNDQRFLDLYDKYAHGLINRREFLDRIGAITASGTAALAVFNALAPNYALASQVDVNDPGIEVGYQEYDSPDGAGKMRAYRAIPAGARGRLPAVVVIHENRGLNPYIEDVARRVAKAGFIGFAPDALTPLGGYPGNDDDGRTMQQQRDRDEMLEDFVAAVRTMQEYDKCNGKVGCVGFCYGGGVANALAVRLPDLGGAVPFYGRQPAAEEVAQIRAPLLIHYAELDSRVNDGWPAYQAALDESGKEYEMHMYAAANHGFHNDTTPRYDEAAARLAWHRTIEFFDKNLV
ncbi:MAG: dienelactone hydrolase family protein [Proteobacteria bacterium]|nr:dienelactone hydrolase family protein [Pseudomonadota bacterium]MDA0994448.1 dienelactone hydrolase family protein [Pseudomonadota bacterium]